MLPKDLLVDLEQGDRTQEHLEPKQTPLEDMNDPLLNGIYQWHAYESQKANQINQDIYGNGLFGQQNQQAAIQNTAMSNYLTQSNTIIKQPGGL